MTRLLKIEIPPEALNDLTSLQNWIFELQRDWNIPVCDTKCCHYAEGCALGYRTQPSAKGDLEDELRQISLVYNEKFLLYWMGKTGNNYRTDIYLPCSHRGCRTWRCELLDDESVMTPWYRNARTLPTPEEMHAEDLRQKQIRTLEHITKFNSLIQELPELMCPKCQSAGDFKVFHPDNYKRGEIICRNCCTNLLNTSP